MSAWDAILTQLEVHWRTAVPTLPAGTLGVERGPDRGIELDSGSMPHVYFYDLERLEAPILADDDGPVAFNQVAVAYSLRMDLWTRGDTQDAIRTKVEALRAAIKADPTIDGNVEFGWLAVQSIREADFADKPERKAELVFQAVLTE